VNSAPVYREQYPGGFTVEILNLPSGLQIAILLGGTKAAGTYGVLVFSPDALLTQRAGFEGDTTTEYLAQYDTDTTPLLAIDIGAGGI
jgi:hypothetical protein